jgi:hypothetical protein
MRTGMTKWGACTVLSLAMAWAGPSEGQQLAGLRCSGSEPVGSLGITGIKCARCRFVTEGGASRAVFFTEPAILSLDPEKPASRVLRAGDVIVAIGGDLITTAEGSARYSSLPPAGDVRVRVRREGRLVDLQVPTGAVCPTPTQVPEPTVVGQPIPDPAIPPPPPKWTVERAVPAAPVPAAEPTPEAVPEPPAALGLTELPPRVSLGFGFQCSQCSFSDNRGAPGEWSFTEPPNIFVMRGSEAWHEGLRSGDQIIAIGGVPITSEEGGQMFAAIQPGDRVSWTVERLGDTLRATTTAREQQETMATEPELDPSEAPVRFSGTIGATAVEVRGGRVTVTESEDGRVIVIRTRDTEIRLVARAGQGRR